MSSRQSPTTGVQGFDNADVRGHALDLLRISQKTAYTERQRCTFGAPYIAVVKDGIGTFGQGCCKQWKCRRCSKIYAAYHQHRMIEGAQQLMETGPLYFWTLTCRGKDLDLETADDDYLFWTNRFLSALRYRCKTEHCRWAYVQVTERQQRGAAHSHLLHTFLPSDAIVTSERKGIRHYSSNYFRKRCVSAGLGVQYDLSEVGSPVAVSTYIAGYLKKHLQDDVWPSNWRRIRYSQDFPDTTEKPDWALALINRDAWGRLETYAVINRQHFTSTDRVAYEYGRRRAVGIEPPEPVTT